ncbi:MAG TPA: MFS transporter [Vicinamibacterales bacterium]|nr:MFS transporter [Vicinamibacterales bacterium]
MLPQSPFAALQHRNFRLLWSGLIVSFSGSNMQTAALLWHVSLLVPPGKRPIALGMVGLVRLMPIIFFSIAGGTLADASDRRRVMLITQTGMALTALALAILTFRGLSHPWPLYALAAVGASFGAFDAPARQSLTPTLVPREHLPNAISLHAIAVQLASVVGPSVGGVLIATVGIEWVYAVNAVTFVCVIAAILMMRDVPARSIENIADFSVRAVRDGFGFVFCSPIIRSTMLLDFFATFFSSATALLPIFAQDILRVGARGYGWLYAAPSVGAVLMSIIMVRSIERIERRGIVLLWAVTAYGAATIVFGLSHSFVVAFFCLAVTGAADTVSMVLRNVVRQLGTPDHLRGRMTGINMVFFQGGPQLGELEAGVVAQWIGPRGSVVTGGIGCLIATAWIAARTPALRKYRRSLIDANEAGRLRSMVR